MKKLTIKQVNIEDWRIFENYSIDLSDHVTRIKGDNETGKTNIASAITWVFNGNSIDGNVLTNVIPINRVDEHPSPKVELECVISGGEYEQPVTFAREYKAVFLRDGSYKEHKTVTYINGVEMTIAKFNDWIAQNLCDIEMFGVLCNVKAFTEQLKPAKGELVWQKQRRIIEQLVTGEIDSEYDMAKNNEQFSNLAEHLARHGKATEYLKQIRQEQSSIAKTIEEYPVKVSAVESEFVETGYTYDDITKERERNQRVLDSLEKKNNEYRAALQNGANTALANKLKELNVQRDAETATYRAECRESENNRRAIDFEIQGIQRHISEAKANIEALRGEYSKKAKTDVQSVCPTCGQNLPQAKVETVKKQIAKELEEIKQKGIEAKKILETLNVELMAKKSQFDNIIEPEEPKIISELSKQIYDITVELSAVKQSPDMPEYEETKQQYKNEFENIIRKEYVLKHNETLEARLEEMKKAHKTILARQSELQMASDLCKDFIAYRCNIIEQKVNESFGNGIQCKMFRLNKGDGELKETFEIYFNGKMYGDSLSLSTKTLVSYWITVALQNAIGVYIPIVLDNMESVSFYEVNEHSQLVLLEKILVACPNCGSESTGRRNIEGKWKCPNCGKEFVKELIVNA